ncbi:hypothetical protein H5410_016513 [Solanum commersonii]|uniref:Uncharacterized protein n=1 Tax=Solanum commersonii TaxID=4109 RepID=A0A9J5ZWP1_SOLCO|nr:hypothetical protein H5410_016513 [Solanum commersonii]
MEEMTMNEEKQKTLTMWALKSVKRGIINVKLQELLWSSTRPKVVVPESLFVWIITHEMATFLLSRDRKLLAVNSCKAHSWKLIAALVDDLGQPNNLSANRDKCWDRQFIEHVSHLLLFDMIMTKFSKTGAFNNRNSERQPDNNFTISSSVSIKCPNFILFREFHVMTALLKPQCLTSKVIKDEHVQRDSGNEKSSLSRSVEQVKLKLSIKVGRRRHVGEIRQVLNASFVGRNLSSPSAKEGRLID